MYTGFNALSLTTVQFISLSFMFSLFRPEQCKIRVGECVDRLEKHLRQDWPKAFKKAFLNHDGAIGAVFVKANMEEGDISTYMNKFSRTGGKPFIQFCECLFCLVFWRTHFSTPCCISGRWRIPFAQESEHMGFGKRGWEICLVRAFASLDSLQY